MRRRDIWGPVYTCHCGQEVQYWLSERIDGGRMLTLAGSNPPAAHLCPAMLGSPQALPKGLGLTEEIKRQIRGEVRRVVAAMTKGPEPEPAKVVSLPREAQPRKRGVAL
ncbi:MAG: hypothetical protein ACUVX1_14465 [Chloroflexota bacterium]